jgi:hypothetical protein
MRDADGLWGIFTLLACLCCSRNRLAVFCVCAGGADILADPDDTVILLRKLPKLFAHHHEPKYGHLDFIWGYNAVHRVYWRVLEVLASLP